MYERVRTLFQRKPNQIESYKYIGTNSLQLLPNTATATAGAVVCVHKLRCADNPISCYTVCRVSPNFDTIRHLCIHFFLSSFSLFSRFCVLKWNSCCELLLMFPSSFFICLVCAKINNGNTDMWNADMPTKIPSVSYCCIDFQMEMFAMLMWLQRCCCCGCCCCWMNSHRILTETWIQTLLWPTAAQLPCECVSAKWWWKPQIQNNATQRHREKSIHMPWHTENESAFRAPEYKHTQIYKKPNSNTIPTHTCACTHTRNQANIHDSITKQNQIGVLPVSLCMNRKTKSKKQKLKCSSQYVQFKWTTYSSWDSNLMITAVFVVVCFCWKLISSHIFIKWLNAFKLLLIFFRVRQIFFSSFQIHYLSSLHFDAMKCQYTGNATQSFMLH